MTAKEVWDFIREHGGYTEARKELRDMVADKMRGNGDWEKTTNPGTYVANMTRQQIVGYLTDEKEVEAPGGATAEKTVVGIPAEETVQQAEQQSLPFELDDDDEEIAALRERLRKKAEKKAEESKRDAKLAAIEQKIDGMKMPEIDVAEIAKAVAAALKPAPTADSAVPTGPRVDPIELAKACDEWRPTADAVKTESVNKLKNFLSEFSLWTKGISARFVNTFCATDESARTKFVTSYAEVAKEERLDDLKAKLGSPEWAAVLDAFKNIKARHLNKRLACFYGEPGGGKTYQAIECARKANGGSADIMPCHAGMDPAALLFEYRMDYETGKKGFVPSALLKAMTNGLAIVLDEINLLPTESVMFLQNITDNKEAVAVMGQTFNISSGFFVLGTMNIETGMGVIPLPPALADRCAIVKEFKMTSEQLVAAAGI